MWAGVVASYMHHHHTCRGRVCGVGGVGDWFGVQGSSCIVVLVLGTGCGASTTRREWVPRLQLVKMLRRIDIFKMIMIYLEKKETRNLEISINKLKRIRKCINKEWRKLRGK